MSTALNRIHGHFEITLEGRILVNRTWGPWNRELILAYREEMDRIVNRLAGERWAMLAFASKEPMHTPDSLAEMVAAIAHQRMQGRCATAVVLQDVVGEGMVKMILSRMYTEAGEPFIFADDADHARSWLQSQLQGG
jgi:hypothetical protein